MASILDTALKVFQLFALALLAAMICGLIGWFVYGMGPCLFSLVLALAGLCVVMVCGITAYETWTSDSI